MAYSCADHQNTIQAELEEIYGDSVLSKTYEAKTRALDAVARLQTANIPDLGKCKTLKVYWDEYCETTVDACDDSCTLTPNISPEGNCQSYSVGECVSKAFTIRDEDFECNAFEISKAIAKKEASIRKLLLEEINKQYVAKIDLLAGQNNYVSTDANYVVGATSTTIPSSYWGVSTLAPYLNNVEDYNFSGVLLSGSKLHSEAYVSQFALSDESRERANLLGSLGLAFDNRTVDQTIGNGALLIDPNAIVLANYGENIHGSLQEAVASGEADGFTAPHAWRETWTTDGGVSFVVDRYYQKTCVKRGKYAHTIDNVIRWDLFNRPASLCEGTTGVLKFICA